MGSISALFVGGDISKSESIQARVSRNITPDCCDGQKYGPRNQPDRDKGQGNETKESDEEVRV